MADVREGRWTVAVEGDFVVFIIGFRMGNPLRMHRAWPLLLQMPRMLEDLTRDPDSGLLAFQTHGGPLGVIVQYWRSFEHLERYSRDMQGRHGKVWREWYRRALDKNPSVGIWHETYRVRAGEYEAIYGGMPPKGLGKAGTLQPVGGGNRSARGRMGRGEPALADPTDS